MAHQVSIHDATGITVRRGEFQGTRWTRITVATTGDQFEIVIFPEGEDALYPINGED